MTENQDFGYHVAGTITNELLLANAMMQLVREEGHRPRQPSAIGHGVPKLSPHRETLKAFFNKNRGPITTSMVAAACNISNDTVKDLCKIFKDKEGWLQGDRTSKGYIWRVSASAVIPT